ncbi:MAG: hypothetical protein K9L17_03845 [Clostridiales bacterium]|nr:hypothetical protein [Clostridiales bacterium]MCF8021811.1 hypothetical protein [Clostridiales bacterium]
MLGADKVILVDSFLGKSPGTIKRFTENELPGIKYCVRDNPTA